VGRPHGHVVATIGVGHDRGTGWFVDASYVSAAITTPSRWSAEEIEAAANALNTRLRKTLGWKTPPRHSPDHLLSVQRAGDATTG
jgi:hypothetical protein